MKKMMVAALLMIGMTSFAQEKAPMAKKEKMEQMTPEQKNELRLKKMTLELGLNASQQKDMSKIISEQSAKMEAAKAERKAKAQTAKPTADEQFARQSKRLDEQIAMNERIKKILTPEQFEKWEKMKAQKKYDMKKAHAGKRKMKGEDK